MSVSVTCGIRHDLSMDLYLAGAGGVGREALDVALAQGRRIVAFLDDELAGQTVRGLPVLAPSEAPRGEGYLIAIADPAARARLSDLLDRRGMTAVTLIHRTAAVGPETSLAAGCLVHANAYISSSVSIGAHCQVHYNATIGHDATLDERVTVYPGGLPVRCTSPQTSQSAVTRSYSMNSPSGGAASSGQEPWSPGTSHLAPS